MWWPCTFRETVSLHAVCEICACAVCMPHDIGMRGELLVVLAGRMQRRERKSGVGAAWQGGRAFTNTYDSSPPRLQRVTVGKPLQFISGSLRPLHTRHNNNNYSSLAGALAQIPPPRPRASPERSNAFPSGRPLGARPAARDERDPLAAPRAGGGRRRSNGDGRAAGRG